MPLTPKPTRYNFNVGEVPVSVSVIDYGPVAHMVADTESPDYEPGVWEFFGALMPVFFAHINKPCQVQIPSASFLVWGDFPRLCISCPAANRSDPLMIQILPRKPKRALKSETTTTPESDESGFSA
jgi:hypothetical protein